jgi:hypothetical protein
MMGKIPRTPVLASIKKKLDRSAQHVEYGVVLFDSAHHGPGSTTQQKWHR